jgi:cytochrome c peroxidase
MHDGSLATLDEVYDFYAQIDRGLDPALSGIGPVVGTARADMTAFLRALTDTASTDDAPTEVPSGLPVGGTRRARR